ncbi:MAG TPA: ATP-dependent helicase [Elusimicrobia bacterium]|nr:ATP-dependent helicase [Elusimicrobiota bacterium]
MIENENKVSPGFYGLGIAPKLLSALDALKFETPTPIQTKAIPPALEGKDLVGIAQTGTGKTIAFAIPVLQRLAGLKGRGLVLVPTRELALQVNDVFKQFAPLVSIQTSVIIGGESISRQQQDLRKKPRVIIATPGRLIDHMRQRTVRLDDVCVLVLDEADRMFDMGFAPQINRILEVVPKERQTMLFSATMPDEIMKLAAARMKLPLRVEVARPGTAIEKTKQEVFMVSKPEKAALLASILGQYGGSVLLFVRTKRSAHRIVQNIRESGHTAAEIHSNRSLNQRKEALDGFKSGRYRVLVATDIAARGIDVIGIELVINYDLPDENENYVHRIGRTGRAGQPGHAISFATPDQRGDLKAIERLLRTILPVVPTPKLAQAPQAPAKPKAPSSQLNTPAPVAKPAPRPSPARPHTQGQFARKPPQYQAQRRPPDNTRNPMAPYRRSEGGRPRPFGAENRADRPPYNPTHHQDTPTRPYGHQSEASRNTDNRTGQQIEPKRARTQSGNFRFTAPGRPRPFGAENRADRPPYNPTHRQNTPSSSGNSRVIVSPSPYFDEPRRYDRPQHGQNINSGPRPPARRSRGQGGAGPAWQTQRPGQEQRKKPVPESWFARFMKKKKDNTF